MYLSFAAQVAQVAISELIVCFIVAIEEPISGLEFSVIDCTVTDEGANESYDIYRDMCVDKFVGTTVDGQSNTSEIRFSYLAFQFASATEDETREVLTCKG